MEAINSSLKRLRVRHKVRGSNNTLLKRFNLSVVSMVVRPGEPFSLAKANMPASATARRQTRETHRARKTRATYRVLAHKAVVVPVEVVGALKTGCAQNGTCDGTKHLTQGNRALPDL